MTIRNEIRKEFITSQSNIYTALKSDEYNFLDTNEKLKDNIALLCLSGSYAYGTNIETSDVDIRGFAIERKEDLLTNNNFEQVIDNTTDTTIYSLRKVVSLLSNCNPNVIELLGCKKEHYIYLNDIGKRLLDNKELFLSKNAYKTFGGYASAQLRRLDNKSSRVLSKTEQEQHILNTILHAKPYDSISLSLENSGENVEKEICISGSFNNIPFREFYSNISEINSIVRDYDKQSKRNNYAIEHGKLSKHMMHLIRLYLMCIDILKDGEIITYRDKNIDLLMDIRNGKYLNENNLPTSEFFDMVKYYENEMKQALDASSLPKNPDYTKINELLINIYEEFLFK